MLRHAAIVLLVAFQLGDAVAQATSELYRLDIKETGGKKGRKLEMSFKEVERQAESSVVDITHVSGSGADSAVAILKGMCGLARARGQKYFQYSAEAPGSDRYLVSFPKTVAPSDVNPTEVRNKVISLADCELVNL
jgi:hypothetical protein